MKKMIPTIPPSQSNSLAPQTPGVAPKPAMTKPKPFGRRMTKAEPSMSELADRTHPTKRG